MARIRKGAAEQAWAARSREIELRGLHERLTRHLSAVAVAVGIDDETAAVVDNPLWREMLCEREDVLRQIARADEFARGVPHDDRWLAVAIEAVGRGYSARTAAHVANHALGGTDGLPSVFRGEKAIDGEKRIRRWQKKQSTIAARVLKKRRR